jgi:hypothetical protein
MMLPQVRKFARDADVHALESSSGRSALHKAAYWGHEQLTAVRLPSQYASKSFCLC